MRIILFFTLLLALGDNNAVAQTLSLDMGEGGGQVTSRILQLIALITVISLAPSILVMVTSFTRIVVVFSFLRTALGLQQTPPNSVIISLSLFLTMFIMQPVFMESYNKGLKPLMDEEITEEEAIEPTIAPFKVFMLQNVREKDLGLFFELSDTKVPEKIEETSLRILIPAFMISELRRAFEIGFLLFIPFLIIDLMVASTLMAMGMMMLPPVLISLPFKLIFFVLIDGWYMVVGSLVKSFGG
ncbi:MAG: flagellar type III secretion system pore protein FliP [Rickettsiales bacterium]|nr:flagellar type III secretion system pore protein FliP [Pseudomonadota bacterium]MDA0965506.1 flagellar type III secretion system pore protein FliP [Pseudomonadota bacterium]MDG4542830.1 flagellar type III secretion system pore protein FliP [Rickettsiales bacterium]MDG4544722.1 flagellar type III secretion system pore protein FliP [Rickettsiales bacterium]MDG4546844.1 flagellar type III secretion system pore protein FliP [Rickettsiales bacterium]